MTNRARWLMFLGLVGLFVGVLRGQAVLSLSSASLFVWILVEWIRFQARVHFQLPQLQFERRVNGRNDTSGTLWVGRTVKIEVRIFSPNVVRPRIQIRDVVPEILELLAPIGMQKISQSSSNRGISRLVKWLEGHLNSKEHQVYPANQWTLESKCKEARFSYTAGIRAAGQLTLPGIRLTLEDAFGFFLMHRFVQLPQTFRLLPDYFQSGEVRPTVKRNNSLPQHGIHRLQRSGTGAELLELREYVPGDPPKSIAWKVSARRDKLMTRKYESEVPVRVHLFIDGSFSTRIGGYGLRLLDQINFVAASVARAAISVGDPVSGVLVDETTVRRLPWFAGERGFLQLLKALAEFSDARPPAPPHTTPYLVQCALRICQERHPELLERRYHRIPFSFFVSTRERFYISGVLAEVFSLSACEQVECLHDNERLSFHLHDFLHRVGMPWMAPMITEATNPAVAGADRIQTLNDAMAKAIAHARDNEVFVVLADLLSCAPNLGQMLRVVKLALAKHHRVVFVCPMSTFSRPTSSIIQPKSEGLHDLLLASEQARARDIALQMKRELVRLGVSVAFAGERSAIHMVIAEMDLARDGLTRLQGSRS